MLFGGVDAHPSYLTIAIDDKSEELAAGLIPEVYPKPPAQREILQLVRHRDALVGERTRLTNRVHSHLLHQQGLEYRDGRLLGRTWLRKEAWPWLSAEQRPLVETHLKLIDTITPQIQRLDGPIEERARNCPAAELLPSIPGTGSYRSLVLAAELTPIERFPSPDHLVCCSGLASLTRSSDGHTQRGSIPQAANLKVRGVLISAVERHRRTASSSSVSRFYQRSAKALGSQTARVAPARKLCRVVDAVLPTGDLWRE